MTEAEITWTKHITKGILGFSERSIEIFVQGQANSVCKNLKLPLLFEAQDLSNNPLRKVLRDHLPELSDDSEDTKGSLNARSSIFTNNSTQYAKAGLKLDL